MGNLSGGRVRVKQGGLGRADPGGRTNADGRGVKAALRMAAASFADPAARIAAAAYSADPAGRIAPRSRRIRAADQSPS